MATEIDLEIERVKLRAEEKRIAAELKRVELQKKNDWDNAIDARYQADYAGELYLRILAHVREEITYDWK